MKVWLLRASEIFPIDGNTRVMRVGMLAEELSKDKNNDVTWFCSTFDHFKKKQLFNKNTTVDIKDNYRLKMIYAKGYKKNISLSRIINHKIISLKLRKMIRKEEKPDIIFASFPTIEFALEAVKYGKKNNIPVIIDVRDLWPDIFKHNLKGIVRIMAIPYIHLLNHRAKKILSSCYKITSISDLMLDWALNKANRDKTRLDKSFYIGYKKENISSEKKESIVEKSFDICFFATINNQFNYDLVSEIGKSLEGENVNLIICGSGPMWDILNDKCKNISNIKLLGWCEDNVLKEVLNKSKMGFAPYKDTFDFQKSISNKFCEYLSNGLPIIITCRGLMKNVIDKNEVGIASQNVEDIKRFILDLRDNNQKWQKMSNNAISLYHKYFNAEKIYPKMVKYISDVRKEYNK